MMDRLTFTDKALLVAVVGLHVILVIAPTDVLKPIDPHHLGQLLWHGHVPYRDFAFEYPPLAALAFLLPGLVPAGAALSTMALQAVALEIVVAVVVLRHVPGAVRRAAVLSLLVFPFLSGGFDALPMAAIAVSTWLLARDRPSGWWVAAVGAMTKLSPAAAWAWSRRAPVVAALALVATVAVAIALPLALARHRGDSWIGYTADRGVEAESVAASTAWVGQRLQGNAVRIEYNARSRSNELRGAGGAATAWTVIAAAGLIALALACGRRGPDDAFLASFVAVLLLMIGSKVLSPQFVAWPAPLAAVLGRRWFGAWVVVAGLTYLAYGVADTTTSLLAITLARNSLLVVTAGAGLAVLARQRLQPVPTTVDLRLEVADPT